MNSLISYLNLHLVTYPLSQEVFLKAPSLHFVNLFFRIPVSQPLILIALYLSKIEAKILHLYQQN